MDTRMKVRILELDTLEDMENRTDEVMAHFGREIGRMIETGCYPQFNVEDVQLLGRIAGCGLIYLARQQMIDRANAEIEG